MQRCALAGIAAFAMVSLVASDQAYWQRSLSPAYLGGWGGLGLQLPVPVGSCFVSKNTQVGRGIRARLHINLRDTRVIAVYAPCDPKSPLAQPATYGGYAEIVVNPVLIAILGKDYDTGAYVQDMCSALRGSRSQTDFEKAWRSRLNRVAETASLLIERARKNAKVNSFWPGERSFLLTDTQACLSWALGVETSADGPIVGSRIEGFGIAVKGRHLMLIDHAAATDAEQINAHVARFRRIIRELVRLNQM
jgi:hypothetical protein